MRRAQASSTEYPRYTRAAPVAYACTVVLCVSPRFAWARDISFAQARADAERAAPDLRLAERRVDVANAEVEAVGALPNPTVSVSTARQTARVGTSVDLPLPLFGQRASAVRAARADADAVRLDVAVVRREVRWRATIAWVDLWEAQERARLQELAAQEAERLFQIANERFSAGTGPRLDVVRTRADRAKAGAEAEAARRLTGAASARLSPWIGAQASEQLSAAGTAGFPEGLQVTLDGLEQKLAVHTILQRDRAKAMAAERHLANERRQRWPLLTPQLTVNHADPTLPGTDIIVGISVELPVLSLRRGAIARAEAQRTLADANAQADARWLQADLLDAYRRTQVARLRLRALRDQVLPAMEEARNMTEEGYRSGRIDLIRLLEAQRALLDSRLAEAEAAASWNRAVADLERAAGADFAEGDAHAP
jgi:cobalt-zinc-cadmium efflux system outer membrane protein